MKKILPFSLLITVLFLSACNTTQTKDIQVKSTKAPSAKLSDYKTYAWAGSVSALNDPEGKWQHADLDISETIQSLIDRELQKKNLAKIQGKNADIAMSFFTGVDMEAKKLKAAPDSNVDIPTDAPKAALIIVALDVKTGYVVWVGVATGDVTKEATVETTKARLDYAITKIFNAELTK